MKSMEIYLIFVNTSQNSNKFWCARIELNGSLTVQWGRVGYQAQTKVYKLDSYQKAINKFNSLIDEKKSKGYIESHPEMNGERNILEIRRAIELLNVIRRHVASKNYNDTYLSALNDYLKIVPTPLGMQIDFQKVYQTVSEVDYQRELLNSLLPIVAPQTESNITSNVNSTLESKTVSLRAISKNFWRTF